MYRLPIEEPVLDLLQTHLRARIDRARGEDTSRGASAVEWVVISAIVVAIVATVGYVIKNALAGRADSVSNCISGADGTTDGC
jgi:Flp pilus assembly pilin Flp